MSEPILALKGLSSGYGSAEIVHDVDLALGAGEILTVLGKNGMGKTTLLKTIMGFLPASAGLVHMAGRDVTRLAPHLMAGAGLAYAPQEYTLFQELSVEDNLRLGVADDRAFKARLPMLEDVFPRMLERLKQRAGTLSGGEQKMLLMSRAVLAQPRVMLVDEISEGLQPSMVDRMAEVLREIRDRHGTAVLLVEQNLAFALAVADRFAVLKLGEIVEQGPANAAQAKSLAEHLKV